MIGKIISKKRKEMKISLRKAAEKIGVSHATLYYCEAGVYQPRVDTLAKLVQFFELDANDILNATKKTMESEENDK